MRQVTEKQWEAEMGQLGIQTQFTTIFTGKLTIFRPTEEEIANIKVGYLAPNCFGEMAQVTRIYARGRDTNGRLFICYYTRFGDNARISNRLKAGEVLRTPLLSNTHSSVEIDRFDIQ